MKIRTAKAAILAQSRKPLVVDEIEFPEALDVGQVLVKVLHTSICGAQINEIEAVKGPDKFLPHLLGHEASGTVIETGPGVTQRQAGRHRRAALAPEPGHPEPAPRLPLARREAQRRLGDDLQRLRHRLREPDDGDPRRFRSQDRAAVRLRGHHRGRRDQQRRGGEGRRVGGGVRGRRRRACRSCNSPRSPAPTRWSPSISLGDKLEMARVRGATHCIDGLEGHRRGRRRCARSSAPRARTR